MESENSMVAGLQSIIKSLTVSIVEVRIRSMWQRAWYGQPVSMND